MAPWKFGRLNYQTTYEVLHIRLRLRSDPLIVRDIDTGAEAIRIFRTKEDAQVEASENEPEMRIIECEVKIV